MCLSSVDATFGAALTMLAQLLRSFPRYQDSHILFLILFGHLCRFRTCCTFPERFKTQTLILSNTTTNRNMYIAANITLDPSDSELTQVIHFVPSSAWIGSLCDTSTTSESNSTFLVEQFNSVNFAGLSRDYLETLPPWSLWADRSVLVVTIYQMNFSGYLPVCPILSFRAVPVLAHSSQANVTYVPSTFCRPEFGLLTANCYDESAAYYALFSLASVVSLTVYDLGPHPRRFRGALGLIVSSGYRLPHGVFDCPSGLFACSLPVNPLKEQPRTTSYWQQRICLPLSLRCDGVPNCPDSGSDERGCGSSDSVPVPTRFNVVDGEKELLDEFLTRFDAEILRLVGHYSLTAAGHIQTPILSALLIITLLLVVVISFAVFWLVRHTRASKAALFFAEENHNKCSSFIMNDVTSQNALSYDPEQSALIVSSKLDADETVVVLCKTIQPAPEQLHLDTYFPI
ncbi:hypothetical protein PHET_03941 [Paragonimus heterotremus]|uniref:Uncharacterized protein n=1 Tax=Paragonimus heterotremus TaxID=100268 RepID=A0A8J4WIR7_9TREM|nr:hypothetical protein PHET_03941 [Paragonimus heterotremus]